MASPYQSALQINPQKEKDVLTRLKGDSKKMAELGLDPTESFANLKSNPDKYDRVMSYVKSEAYKDPAYQSVLGGETESEFVSGQIGEYGQAPEQRRSIRAPELEKKFDVAGTKKEYGTYASNAPVAGAKISDQVKEKGGYDVEARQEEFSKIRTEYTNAYQQFVNGEMDMGAYADVVSRLGTAQRNLDKTGRGYEREVKRGLGEYESRMTGAKQAMDNAYSNFEKTLEAEMSGYTEGRKEKIKSLEDMFGSVSDMLETAKKEEKAYEKEQGNVYNPSTGEFEPKPKTGSGGDKALYKQDVDDMRSQLSSVVGDDGFISPDDDKVGRNAWIEQGLDPADYDKEFKGFRNPKNPYYVTTKASEVDKAEKSEEEEPERTFDGGTISTIARSYSKQLGVKEAKKLIAQGQISVNGKLTKLTKSQVQEILDSIDEQYPEGKRSTWQKILPKGK